MAEAIVRTLKREALLKVMRPFRSITFLLWIILDSGLAFLVITPTPHIQATYFPPFFGIIQVLPDLCSRRIARLSPEILGKSPAEAVFETRGTPRVQQGACRGL